MPKIKSGKCVDCQYRSALGSAYSCDYILIVGHSRGCKPGNECTMYEKGNKLPVEDEWAKPNSILKVDKGLKRLGGY